MAMVDLVDLVVDVQIVLVSLMVQNVAALVMMLLVAVVLAEDIGLEVVVEILVAISKVLAAAVVVEIMEIPLNQEIHNNQEIQIII